MTAVDGIHRNQSTSNKHTPKNKDISKTSRK